MEHTEHIEKSSPLHINLAIGSPSTKYLPIDIFNETLKRISQNTDQSILQYGKPQGVDEFVKVLAQFLFSQYNLPVDHKNLIVTHGITGGLSLLLSLFSQKDSTIFCEGYTYFLALKLFADFKLNVKPISIDTDGLVVSELKEMLELEDPNKKIFLYTIPIHHNPTGYCMSKNRLKELVNLTNNHPNLIVFADEVYQMLSFNPIHQYKPMCYAHHQFISLGSFSKIFCPAIKIGWIHSTNNDFLRKILSSGSLQASGCLNPLGSIIMCDILKRDNVMNNIIVNWNKMLVDNAKELIHQLAKHIGQYIESIDIPSGGYFLWVKFKESISMTDFSKIMNKYGIIFYDGKKFSCNDHQTAHNYARFSFSWCDKIDYEQAVLRLKYMIESNNKN